MKHNLIIPLAGPDYFSYGMPKGQLPFNGGEFLFEVLYSRPWFSYQPNLIFVLLDSKDARDYFNYIKHNIKNDCKVIFLSNPSNGPLWSSLSGISLVNDFSLPLIIDFADIYAEDFNEKEISSLFDGKDYFFCHFKNSSPSYSYINIQGDNAIAREKQVISYNASLGLYGFRETKFFLDLISEYLNKRNVLSHNDLDYITPIFDGCLSTKINLVELKGITDIKEA